MGAGDDRIRILEELAFNAWPALQTLVVDGWILRFADGFTKRANSVNAWRPGGTELADLVATAEPLYRDRGLRPIFRLSPLAPPAIDALLAARGYQRTDETSVQCAATATAPEAAGGAAIARRADAAWLAGYAEATGLAPPQRDVLGRMLALCHLPCAFATIAAGGAPAAFGYAVLERGHLGIFDVVTAAAHRRRGLGAGIVTSLMRWGAARGAAQAYLQVIAENRAALSLYARLGFAEAYRYHYRVAAR